MQFVIVTGMSGAGKSTVLKFLEDMGFFCVDNLPPTLIAKFAEVCFRQNAEIEQVALGIDIRGGKLFDDSFVGLDSLSEQNFRYTILFLDASDESLQKRYQETRHVHPLAKNDRVITGIEKERAILENVKKKADYIIDTSFVLTRQLKEKLIELFIENKKFNSLMINIMSFGFKYGMPEDSDLVFDVRFIPNPFYVADLKEQTGNDEPVKNFVFKWEMSGEFLDKLKDMVCFLIPNYVNEGKNNLVISIGCTGGKHRSVAIANALFDSLQLQGHSVIINHRDIERDAKR